MPKEEGMSVKHTPMAIFTSVKHTLDKHVHKLQASQSLKIFSQRDTVYAAPQMMASMPTFFLEFPAVRSIFTAFLFRLYTLTFGHVVFFSSVIIYVNSRFNLSFNSY